ncbi:hypothetical protein L249_2567, partial [Ophiocordyceps polyrhachis-furcata BCC 54312]
KVKADNKLEYNNVAIRYTFPFYSASIAVMITVMTAVQRADRCDDRCNESIRAL